MSLGVSRLSIPSSGPLTVQDSLSVTGPNLTLGSGSRVALSSIPTSTPALLRINPDMSFSQGVLINGATLLSSTQTRLATPVVVSSSGAVPSLGMLRVDGSIRGKKGVPQEGGPAPTFGYGFDEDAGTGMFSSGGSEGSHSLTLSLSRTHTHTHTHTHPLSLSLSLPFIST